MSARPVPEPLSGSVAASRELCFVSWNVNGCASRRDFDPHAVAAVLLALGADIAALQECGSDAGREHAEAVARSLGVTHAAFGPNVERAGWRYGNAVVSRFPLDEVRNIGLPSDPRAEPRGCVLARVRLGGGLDALAGSAHLGLSAGERARQAVHLLGGGGAFPPSDTPVLLGADGNDWFPGADTRTFRARFRDAFRIRGAGRRATYPARLPLFRLDHVWVCGPVDVLRCEHPLDRLVRSASDHLPVVARVRVAYSAAACA